MHSAWRFYLDKEKDIIVDLGMSGDDLLYTLRTPNHGTGNLITNLAKLCDLPISFDDSGKKIIEGQVPAYIDGYNRLVYIFRLGNTKVANIYPDGSIEMKAQIPAISKTLMSQTKDYRLDIKKTIVKSFIPRDCKFRTDLHTHMNANLKPDILIALGIAHQIRYPLYYIKKLGLMISDAQRELLDAKRLEVAERYKDSPLQGKYLVRRIDDNTFLNFADLILNNPSGAASNIAKIRASLAIMKDGQAVFTNLEKVYLYRYVFTKGSASEYKIRLTKSHVGAIPDADIKGYLLQMLEDKKLPAYRNNSIFQDKLLWIARSAKAVGVRYLEISDTTLVKDPQAADLLKEIHAVMPAVTKETGVTIRFLAAIRRIALTIVKDRVEDGDYFRENLKVLAAIAEDPYVAGADILGEEINDVRELSGVIRRIVEIARGIPDFVLRIHAGENDSLRDNVANSVACVKKACDKLRQPMPRLRIGHGLYTANLNSRKGRALIEELVSADAVLEFQISSNVRLNNLTSLKNHPIRSYLAGGVHCVQGTDGGAIYGTDSIDEQLTLEKLLNLSEEELMMMRRSEDAVLAAGLSGFAGKKARFKRKRITDVAAYYRGLLDAEDTDPHMRYLPADKIRAAEALKGRIEELPEDGTPLVLLGGSFNDDRRRTVLRPAFCALIDQILDAADPKKLFFVIGHRRSGYEQYLICQNQKRKAAKRFRIFSFVPSMLGKKELSRIQEDALPIRISIEPSAMGLYKSVAFEVFKHRASILLALDGNSAGANVIQEANNAKYPCRIYVSDKARILKTKAASLSGYVTRFSRAEEIMPELLRIIQ